MRAYADTSFLVKLISSEPGTEAAAATFRRLRSPRLFLLPLHVLEFETAVRQRAFHQRRTLPAHERGAVAREKEAALSRLQKRRDRGLIIEASPDLESTIEQARRLSELHADQKPIRTLDLLHIAFALELESELFITTDGNQAAVARAEGLNVAVVPDED